MFIAEGKPGMMEKTLPPGIVRCDESPRIRFAAIGETGAARRL
jgi:hypothetical protein